MGCRARAPATASRSGSARERSTSSGVADEGMIGSLAKRLRGTPRRLHDGWMEQVDSAPESPGTSRVFLVPLTHWDREWYEPFEGFLARLIQMMDTLIELAGADPPLAHFHLDGQTAMIDDYLAVRPERREDIERLAREGRISVGPWFTQMDEFLTSGESMIRNLE